MFQNQAVLDLNCLFDNFCVSHPKQSKPKFPHFDNYRRHSAVLLDDEVMHAKHLDYPDTRVNSK